MEYTIAVAATSKAAKWTNRKLTWSELAGALSTVRMTGETMAEYAAMNREEQARIKDVGGFVGGATVTGKRKKGSIPRRGILTLDADNAGDVAEITLKLEEYGFEFLVYPTHSSTPEKPRVRVVIPLSRECDACEYEAIGRKVAWETGMERYDQTTYQMERLMYWPSCSSNAQWAPVRSLMGDGPLNVEEWLAKYKDYRDQEQWPRHASELSCPVRKTGPAGVRQEDPLTKEGLIGAFCRTYTIEEAMEKYLPGVYAPAGKDRYTYACGTSHGGAVTYEHKYIYSNHQSDPGSQQLLNAWDMVRVHKFGHLDDGLTTERKSQKAMEALASSDRTVTGLRIEEQFKGVGMVQNDKSTENRDYPQKNYGDSSENCTEIEENDTEWLEKYMGKNGLRPEPSLFRDIMLNDPGLKGCFARDSFEDRDIFRRMPPWRKSGGVSVTDADMACLRIYISERYHVEGRQKIDDAVQTAETESPYDSLQDALDRLPKWDGVQRAERILTTYLGAADTELNRAMMRRMLLAAYMRAEEPGTKFDQIMVLVGPQGCGKSTFVRMLAMKDKWFSDSLPSPDREKEAMEHLRGKWILEVGEMASMKKADVTSIKMFLSKTHDSFRPAYGKMTVDRPRRCVFFATTNEDEILRDDTGERRYWPVQCKAQKPKKSVWNDMRKEVGLIWAEVATWARDADAMSLILPKPMMDRLNDVQESFKRVDEWDGLIEEWLKIPLPEDWYTNQKLWTVEAKREFFRGGMWRSVNTDHEEFKLRRSTICVAEIINECAALGLYGAASKLDRNRVGSALSRLPMCVKIGTATCGCYGRQKAWEVQPTHD